MPGSRDSVRPRLEPALRIRLLFALDSTRRPAVALLEVSDLCRRRVSGTIRRGIYGLASVGLRPGLVLLLLFALACWIPVLGSLSGTRIRVVSCHVSDEARVVPRGLALSD